MMLKMFLKDAYLVMLPRHVGATTHLITELEISTLLKTDTLMNQYVRIIPSAIISTTIATLWLTPASRYSILDPTTLLYRVE